MFLHIGTDIEVMKKDIIAIIDIKTIKNSKISTYFLQNAKNKGNVCNLYEDNPKSILLLSNNDKLEIYLSPISSTTLQKRINFVKNLNVV